MNYRPKVILIVGVAIFLVCSLSHPAPKKYGFGSRVTTIYDRFAIYQQLAPVGIDKRGAGQPLDCGKFRAEVAHSRTARVHAADDQAILETNFLKTGC